MLVPWRIFCCLIRGLRLSYPEHSINGLQRMAMKPTVNNFSGRDLTPNATLNSILLTTLMHQLRVVSLSQPFHGILQKLYICRWFGWNESVIVDSIGFHRPTKNPARKSWSTRRTIWYAILPWSLNSMRWETTCLKWAAFPVTKCQHRA